MLLNIQINKYKCICKLSWKIPMGCVNGEQHLYICMSLYLQDLYALLQGI